MNHEKRICMKALCLSLVCMMGWQLSAFATQQEDPCLHILFQASTTKDLKKSYLASLPTQAPDKTNWQSTLHISPLYEWSAQQNAQKTIVLIENPSVLQSTKHKTLEVQAILQPKKIGSKQTKPVKVAAEAIPWSENPQFWQVHWTSKAITRAKEFAELELSVESAGTMQCNFIIPIVP